MKTYAVVLGEELDNVHGWILVVALGDNLGDVTGHGLHLGDLVTLGLDNVTTTGHVAGGLDAVESTGLVFPKFEVSNSQKKKSKKFLLSEHLVVGQGLEFFGGGVGVLLADLAEDLEEFLAVVQLGVEDIVNAVLELLALVLLDHVTLLLVLLVDVVIDKDALVGNPGPDGQDGEEEQGEKGLPWLDELL